MARVGGRDVPGGNRPERMASRIDVSICRCSGMGPSRRSSMSNSPANRKSVLY
jgi:hypothetical protein